MKTKYLVSTVKRNFTTTRDHRSKFNYRDQRWILKKDRYKKTLKRSLEEGNPLQMVDMISSEPLSLEDSVRKCREYNEWIFHIQEKIMHDLKQLQRNQRIAPINNQDARRNVPIRYYEISI